MSIHEPNAQRGRTDAPPQYGVGFQIGAATLALLAALAAMGFAYWLRPGPDLSPSPAPQSRRTELTLPASLFAGWDKPDLVLVLSAEEHGYLLPCGCSRPQKGGLERRYNFLQILRDKGWPVVALDLGDVAQDKPPVEVLTNLQQIPKYKYAMYARKAMDYAAVGLGPIEAKNLDQIYGNYALQEDKPPVVSANLHNRLTDFYLPKEQRGIVDWVEITVPGSKMKVGVTSIMGAFHAERMPKGVQFDFGGEALKALKPKAEKVDFRVLLYEGYTNIGKGGKGEAIACAEMFPEYPVVVALNDRTNDEPPGTPEPVKHKGGGSSIVVTLGHKAKYLGVVGVFKTGNKAAPYDIRYQLVEMSEAFLTPKTEEENHPILKLMEDYTTELKDGGYLAKYVQHNHPMQVNHPGNKTPHYAGTDQCKGCHAKAWRIWNQAGTGLDKLAHNQAYKSLVDAKRPSNRQFDPECIVCHTVGFGYVSGFFDEKRTSELLNVGCESCHGPGSGHIDAEGGLGDKKEWRKAINPWKYSVDPKLKPEEQERAKVFKIEQMCIKCHDDDNDVNWKGPGAFEKKWEHVKHYNK